MEIKITDTPTSSHFVSKSRKSNTYRQIRRNEWKLLRKEDKKAGQPKRRWASSLDPNVEIKYQPIVNRGMIYLMNGKGGEAESKNQIPREVARRLRKIK